MSRGLRAVALALVITGCRAGANANADAAADASLDVPVPVPVPVPDSPRASASSPDEDAPYLTAAAANARSIGHTSVVFKIELGGKKAVFKPSSRRGPVRYKGEIAARRLAVALDLSANVPRAFFRAFEAKTLAGPKEADEMIVKDGVVRGALIPWIDHLELVALEQAPLSGEWKAWLRRGSAVPDDKRELARQVSTLVAFDFITANWDRWSGGNVGIDKASGTLLFIDNDGAFFDVPPLEGLARNKRLLEGVDKFSRGFVAKLRALDDESLARVIGEETAGVPLLSPKALAGAAQRRKAVLALVDAKAADAGDDTFAFP